MEVAPPLVCVCSVGAWRNDDAPGRRPPWRAHRERWHLPRACMHACACFPARRNGKGGKWMQNTGGPENRCYMTETRAFGFSVLLGSIYNRETVGKKTCAIKKVAAFAFEAVNDSMVRRCSNERRAYKGCGSFGGWNHGVFRLAYQKLGRSKDKDNRYCIADAVLLTMRLDVPPRRRGRPPAPCRNDPGCSDRFRERRLLRPDLTGAKSPTRAHTHTHLKRKETP